MPDGLDESAAKSSAEVALEQARNSRFAFLINVHFNLFIFLDKHV